MLQRIHTWVPNPVLGDMNYEHEFTNDSYIDLGNGIKFPTGWHSHDGWDDNFQAQAVSTGHNAFGGTLKDIKANVCPDPVTVPDAVRQATFPVRVETTKLADGVYLLGGATHNSVAIEFNRFHRRLRGAAERAAQPGGDRRNGQADSQQADPVRGQFPSAFRPRRRPPDLHAHRRDHHHPLEEFQLLRPRLPQLLAAHAAAGHDVAVAADRVAEGYFYETVRENYVISDGTRNLNIYYVNPLQHVEGMLIAYLPKEKILIEADLVDTNAPLPARLTTDQQSFYRAVRTLKLDPGQMVPVHGNPVPWATFANAAGGEH